MKQIGYIGLGKMGFNMCERLLEKGWEVSAYNRSPGPTKDLAQKGAVPAYSLGELVSHMSEPRLLWLMVSHEAVDSILNELTPLLSSVDVIIDGGNSLYKDSIRRSYELAQKGIGFLDAGVSGGPVGARRGACVMVGGKKETFMECEEVFHDIAAKNAYQYVGPSGAGHFVKMAHNGIEYGMMQSLAEGFALLKQSPFNLDIQHIAELYNNGSVIESRLVEWLADGLEEYGPELEKISGAVSQSGEGLWTVEAGKEMGADVASIKLAVDFRTRSQEKPSYTGKLLSAMRNQFGGHNVN